MNMLGRCNVIANGGIRFSSVLAQEKCHQFADDVLLFSSLQTLIHILLVFSPQFQVTVRQ